MHDGSLARDQKPRTAQGSATFIGRQAEMDVLREALDAMLGGARQVVLLSGEPGIGKTATAAQLADAAREHDALVLWGQCHEWEGAPPYWQWTQILENWSRELGHEQMGGLLAQHSAVLAQILPGIRTGNLGPPALSALEPEARHFQLLIAVAALVRAAIEIRPAVIVLDDIHWADVPTLRLLLFLAQEFRDGHLLLVATYRAAELDRSSPQAAIIADLARVHHSRRLHLHGLPRAQFAHLVARVTGRAQSPALVEALYARTEGNPFFVTEVVRLLADSGQLDDGDYPGHHPALVPASVREAIGRRLVRLSATCVRALMLAAVIGRDVDIRLLASASELPAAELLSALDDAVRAHFLQVGGDPGMFRFSHALVREALYVEISPAERAGWHAAVLRALEEGSGPQPSYEELAHHCYHAAPLVDAGKMALYATRAGDAAVAQFAWDTGAGHYRRALNALNQLPGADIIRHCDLLLSLGEAQNHSGSGAGDAPAARASFAQAFELACQLGDGERMARAAVGYAGVNVVAVFGGPRQLEMLEEALAALGPADSPLRVRLLARLAVDLWNRSSEHLERSQALADEGLTVAERLADPTLIAYARWGRHSCGNRPSNLAERRASSARLGVVAEQTADPIAAVWGQLLYLLDCVEAADMFDAQQAMAWLRGFSERAGVAYIEQRVVACGAMLSLLRGDYAAAEIQVERARTLWQSAEPRQHAAQSFLLLRDLGRLDEAEAIQIPDKLYSWRRAAQAQRMTLALARGDKRAARADYEDLVADNFTRIRLDQHWYATLAPLAEATLAFADASHAAQLYTLLEPYSERLMVNGSLVICHGPGALHLGQLAGLNGHWDTAIEQLGRAQSLCERLDLRPYLARTLLAQAQILAQRNLPGDRAAARSVAQRAAETAAGIGMLGLVPAVDALLQQLAPAAEADFGLTPRELAVLGLVAQGLTDAEVAEQLFLSPRTVGTHLTSIYGKLGVSSRTAATRIAIDHELC